MFARPRRRKVADIGDTTSNYSSDTESNDRDLSGLQIPDDSLPLRLTAVANSRIRRSSSNNNLGPAQLMTKLGPTPINLLGSPIRQQPNGRRSISGSYAQTVYSQTNNFGVKPTFRRFRHQSLSSQELLSLLNRSHTSRSSLEASLAELRYHILSEGINLEDETNPNSASSIRCRAWKALLGVYHVSAGEYIEYVAKGPSTMYEKVKNDTFRTLATDKKFINKVQEPMLVRVLNALVWKSKDNPSSGHRFQYVQGMNVLAAPFLYVMPELDAFYSFSTFLSFNCPLYVQPSLTGVHCGLKLMDRCLEVLDPELFAFLSDKGLSSEIYAFASVMTFSACTPPLDEVLKLWDFLLACGVHCNIICIVAQLMMIRNHLLSSPSPMKILRTFPDLQASPIIQKTQQLVSLLPEPLYDDLVRHPFDITVCDKYLDIKSPLGFTMPMNVEPPQN